MRVTSKSTDVERSQVQVRQSRNPFLNMKLSISDLIRFIIATGFVLSVSRSLDPATDLESGVPYLFLLVLLFGLGVALIRYRHPHAVAAKALQKAAEELKAKQSSFPDSLRDHGHAKASGQRSSAEVSDTVPRSTDESWDVPPLAFTGHQPLLTAWTDFCEARRCSETRPYDRRIVAPTDYFSIDTALGRHIGSLPTTLPGVFTAIGLLGTFVGIAMGLADIVPQGDPQSPTSSDALMQGIRTLMGGMSTAFLTSIVGITWSLWWRFEFGLAERKSKTCLDQFLTEITSMFHVEEPHETLMRVAGANETVGRTANEIRGTAEEIKGNVQSLGQDLAEALEPYFEKHIAEPIRNLNTDLGERQTEALGQMVEAFRETLVDSVKEQLSAFGQSLRDASDHQANAARELERFFDRLVKVSDVQTKLLARTAEVASVFDQGLTGLTAASKSIESAGKSAHDTMTAASDAVDTARALTEESRRQLEVQEEASKAAKRSWDAQVSLLEDMQANFGRLADDLGNKITEFQTASAQKIGEVFHVFDSEMAKVVEHLGGTLAELREVTEELPGTVASLRQAAQDLSDVGRTQHGSLVEGLKKLESAKAEIVGQFNQTRADVHDLEDRLIAFAKEIELRKAEFATVAQDVQRRLEGIAERTETTGARWEENSQQLLGSIDTLAAQISEATNSVVDAVKPVAGRTATVSERLGQLSQGADTLTRALSDLHSTARLLNNSPKPQGARTEAPSARNEAAGTRADAIERSSDSASKTTGGTEDLRTPPRTVDANDRNEDGEKLTGSNGVLDRIRKRFLRRRR